MGDDNEAIKYYTMSLAYANNNELMSHAYANRSAALYRKQLFKECLIDIDAALNLGYPEEKRKKLKERGIKAIEEIKKKLKLTNNDHIDSETFTNMCLSENINNESERSFTVKYKNGETKLSDINKNFNINEKKDTMHNWNEISENNKEKQPRYLADEGPLKLIYGPSKEAPAVSDGISISFSEKYGRHLVVTKEFKPGDIITIEDPYAYVIYTQRYII